MNAAQAAFHGQHKAIWSSSKNAGLLISTGAPFSCGGPNTPLSQAAKPTLVLPIKRRLGVNTSGIAQALQGPSLLLSGPSGGG